VSHNRIHTVFFCNPSKCNFNSFFTTAFWEKRWKKLLYNLPPHLKSGTLPCKMWMFNCTTIQRSYLIQKCLKSFDYSKYLLPECQQWRVWLADCWMNQQTVNVTTSRAQQTDSSRWHEAHSSTHSRSPASAAAACSHLPVVSAPPPTHAADSNITNSYSMPMLIGSMSVLMTNPMTSRSCSRNFQMKQVQTQWELTFKIFRTVKLMRYLTR